METDVCDTCGYSIYWHEESQQWRDTEANSPACPPFSQGLTAPEHIPHNKTEERPGA